MDLKNKRILITGGSSGIGLATAGRLIAKGARIAISARDADRLNAAVETLAAAAGSLAAVVGDVGSSEGRAATLAGALEALGGIDILINNAGAVRAGRLENITEAEIRAMIDVDLLAPILLSRAALPSLRATGTGMIVNITSGIARIGMPFYATYAAAKAGLARFSEALRRELKGEGIHVLTVYPGGTDTPMMISNRAGPELGFTLEPAAAVAEAIVAGMEDDAIDVVRGGDARAGMIARNRSDPEALDQHFLSIKAGLEASVKDHSAL